VWQEKTTESRIPYQLESTLKGYENFCGVTLNTSEVAIAQNTATEEDLCTCIRKPAGCLPSHLSLPGSQRAAISQDSSGQCEKMELPNKPLDLRQG
jgi:hypothetical protein